MAAGGALGETPFVIAIPTHRAPVFPGERNREREGQREITDAFSSRGAPLFARIVNRGRPH